MSVPGFKKGNKHSFEDFGLRIISREMDPPDEIEITESVPGMHGEYDYSSVYGGPTYPMRTIVYYCDFIYKDKIDFSIQRINITKWIMSGSEEKLTDDLIPGYYFLVKGVKSPKFGESSVVECDVTITFKAQPFMYGDDFEGDNEWDTFCFEVDYLQERRFDVSGIKDIDVYNVSSVKITPTVICSSSMQVTKDNITYQFNPGPSKDYRFELNKGNNKLQIKGNGTIEFKFRKELL